jgi:FkbM family methyltransferase
MFSFRRYFRNLLSLFPDALFEGFKQGGWRGGYLACCVFVLRRVPVPVLLPPVITIRTFQEASNYLDNFVQGELRHPEVESLLAESGGHVVELGVNVGITARWWLALGPQVSLTGIDMIAEALDYTRGCLAETGLELRAEFVLAAVGSAPGEIEIAFDDPLEGTNRVDSVSGSQKRRIRVDTVDHLLGEKNQRPIALLKIDIEGQGGEALRGASKTLGLTRWVVVETHHTAELETSAQLLTDQGFVLTAFHGRTMWWRRAA